MFYNTSTLYRTDKKMKNKNDSNKKIKIQSDTD